MQNFKTLKEKAAEWEVTPGHVQYLCKSGKIEGSVKRGGIWFIPDDVPTPIKNTKSNAAVFKFVGTKNKIFNSAIKLFMLRGFNSVSLKDIAGSVGIRQSTIYNHFKSKQEILDTIYDFYCYYYRKDRLSLEKMEIVVQEESLIEIINKIRYDFKEEYEQQMLDITKIIFQRIGIDERAAEISKTLMIGEGVQYVEDVFNSGIKRGRFANFDTHAMAVFVNSVRMFTLYNWIADTSYEGMMKLREDEQALYQYAARLITDLKY